MHSPAVYINTMKTPGTRIIKLASTFTYAEKQLHFVIYNSSTLFLPPPLNNNGSSLHITYRSGLYLQHTLSDVINIKVSLE